MIYSFAEFTYLCGPLSMERGVNKNRDLLMNLHDLGQYRFVKMDLSLFLLTGWKSLSAGKQEKKAEISFQLDSFFQQESLYRTNSCIWNHHASDAGVEGFVPNCLEGCLGQHPILFLSKTLYYCNFSITPGECKMRTKHFPPSLSPSRQGREALTPPPWWSATNSVYAGKPVGVK